MGLKLFIVISKTQCQLMQICRLIADTDLIYWPDFLLETITQLIAHWWKIKNILNKIFSNPLFKMMSCVWIKILFIECKYFGLNTNIFYWMQIYFLKYQIFFIEYKYFFIKSKYIFLNIKYFSLNTNIFY